MDRKYHKGTIKFNQCWTEQITCPILLSALTFFLIYGVYSNIQLASFFSALCFIVFSVYYYFTRTTVYLSRDQMTITTKLSEKQIKLEEVISMSNILINKFLKYQIKTKDNVYSLPMLRPSKEFEQFMSEYCSLQPHVNEKTSFWRHKYNLNKRWKRNGQAYVPTSLLDVIAY